MGWMRQAADVLEDLLGISIARKGNAWTLIEPEQLSRFLGAFAVDCVFDVGANVGQYARRLRKIGYSGRIISFEPNPQCFETLNLLSSRDARWDFEPIALDSVERIAEFNVMGESQLSSLLNPTRDGLDRYGQAIGVAERVTVKTQTLATLFPALQERFGFERPFLKMDTQGHDLAVAEGAGDILARFVGLQSELALSPLYEDSANYARAIDFYRSKGFALSGLIPNNEGNFPDLLETDCLMYNPLFLRRDGGSA
jgi:FkbM family methyltransferase